MCTESYWPRTSVTFGLAIKAHKSVTTVGIEFFNEPINEKYREELNKIADNEGLEKLYNMAKEIDPEAMQKISLI